MNEGRTFPPEPCTEAEVEAMMMGCTDCPTGHRDAAIIAFMWRVGLRVGEVVALKPENLEGERTVRVLRGKGKKTRTLSLDLTTVLALRPWMDDRLELELSDDRLFLTLKGKVDGSKLKEGNKPLSTLHVNRAIHRLARRAGITRRVSPHSLRHTYAKDQDAMGTSLTEISRSMGHRNPLETLLYMQKIVPGKMAEIQAGRPVPEGLRERYGESTNEERP